MARVGPQRHKKKKYTKMAIQLSAEKKAKSEFE
jgi:hypothetical protein